LRKREISKLRIHFKEYDEKILRTLLVGSKSLDQLAEILPKTLLYRSLNRLENRGLITKSTLSGRIFYFATKKRPTKKLAPTEMKLFKALTREELSVRDLSERVGISVGRVYELLRRLRLKRHVKKEKKFTSYRLTDTGKSLAQSLNILNNLI
jgi:predicted transcriptional regulator